MRYTVPHRVIVVALSVLLVGLVGWPAPAGAQISLGGVTGTVTGIVPVVTDALGTATGTLGLGTTTVLAGTGALAGTPDALDGSALAGSIPGLLTVDVLHATTIGYSDEVDSEASIADLALGIGGTTISADFVIARATSWLGVGTTGTFEIDNFSINGVSIAVTGAPNQTIAIPGGQVVINEQVSSSNGIGIAVSALHVRVAGVADVVIGSASADASTTTGQASAVQATGI